MSTHPLHRHNAFTLIELAAAMIVLSITVLLAIPTMDSANRSYLLNSGSSRVMASLRYAQAQSIAIGIDHGVEFSPANNTIRCFIVQGTPPYPSATHPATKLPYLIDFDTTSGLGGVTLASTTFTSDTVTFDSLGSPTEGGSVSVAISGYTKNVTLSAVIGLLEFTDP